MSDSNIPTLYYFDGRGRGEIIRLCLAAAGIQFKEVLLRERADMEKLFSEELLLYRQVPMLQIDGLTLVQTGAILRYIARKSGMYGTSNEESTKIDMYFDGTRDFQMGYMPIGFMDEAEVLKTVKETKLPTYLPIFEKVLADNGTGYVFGKSMTLADVGLLETILNTVEYFGDQALEEYPNIKKFHKIMTEKENISAFLNGPQRKRKNDDRYISEVKTCLARK